MHQWVGCAALSLLFGGCYFLDAAETQLWLVNDQRPLVAARAELSDPDQRAMLDVVPELIAFARDVMQLRPRRNYAGYVHTEAEGLTHVLVACERLRFEPYTWWFPIAGTVAYKSHFSAADAEAEAAELRRAGYDTYVGHSRAYSTLGLLRDPVVTTMMRGGLLEFMEILLHEMAHARLYVPGQTDFNEQLASFVAEQGVRQLLAAPRRAPSGLAAAFEARVSRRQRIEQRVADALLELDALYASARPDAEKLQARDRIFAGIVAALRTHIERAGVVPTEAQLRVNNARLMQWRRYQGGTDRFARLWAASAQRWPVFWRLVEREARVL